MTKPKENPSRIQTSKMTCTLKEFNKVSRALSKMTDERKQAIKRIMVYGASPQAVADELGISRNAIHKSVFYMYRGVIDLRNDALVPSGWARAEILLPRNMIEPIRQMAALEWKKVFGDS